MFSKVAISKQLKPAQRKFQNEKAQPRIAMKQEQPRIGCEQPRMGDEQPRLVYLFSHEVKNSNEYKFSHEQPRTRNSHEQPRSFQPRIATNSHARLVTEQYASHECPRHKNCASQERSSVTSKIVEVKNAVQLTVRLSTSAPALQLHLHIVLLRIAIGLANCICSNMLCFALFVL